MKYTSVLEARGKIGRWGAAAAAATALLLACAPGEAAAQAFDPQLEAKNFAKIEERITYLTGTPEFQNLMQQQNAQDAIDFPLLLANDPARNPLGNICAQRKNECAGDVRFYDWGDDGFGIQTPVLFTGRSGATLSGTVWGTLAGPEPKPGVVITTGSVQAPETLYWGLAAALAKAGYIVLTYDVQGQGRSDTFGETPDQNEGFPSQGGQPFYDGTEDALDFLLSTSASPYVPRPSCSSGTSHATKQSNRVASGLNAAFNPLGTLVDPTRIGIAGHSLGAGAVSFVGQRDPRVDAVVGWDNLGTGAGGGPACASAPATRGLQPLTAATDHEFVPALGMSADYGLVQNPYGSNPNPEGRNGAFNQFAGTTPATAGVSVDSMQVNIRGGTHYEFSLIPGNTAPNPLGAATLRGMDMVSWYTTAWFDKYVKCPGSGDPVACGNEADSDLLTDRWQDDARTEEIDLNADPNMFSFYLRSEYDFGLTGGGRAVCMTDAEAPDDDPLIADGSMRPGCAEMGPDGDPIPYDYQLFADTADEAPPADDTDMDGVPNLSDSCPTVAGPPSNQGCPVPPDGDGDGVPDAADACVSTPGPADNDGCPTPGDSDSDDVPNAADACPNTPGSVDNDGCPLPGDSDGDGVADAADACPDVQGPVQNDGCPTPGDRDGDGIPNGPDDCEDDPGPAENQGCPPPDDGDGDGVNDSADACPDRFGPAENEGCPPFGDRDGDDVVNAQDACADTPGPTSNQGCPIPAAQQRTSAAPCELAATRGTRGADVMNGTADSDHLSGLRGGDTLTGLASSDCLRGQRGRDSLDGGEGADLLRASAGADRIIGGPGADTIQGGLGNDRIDAADGERDFVACGNGVDRVSADSIDRLKGCE